MTREERRELFVKWGTFIVSSVALLVACVRDPIIWTLRATIHEQLGAELAKYETISSASAKWTKHSELGDELTKRQGSLIIDIHQSNPFLLKRRLRQPRPGRARVGD